MAKPTAEQAREMVPEALRLRPEPIGERSSKPDAEPIVEEKAKEEEARNPDDGPGPAKTWDEREIKRNLEIRENLKAKLKERDAQLAELADLKARLARESSEKEESGEVKGLVDKGKYQEALDRANRKIEGKYQDIISRRDEAARAKLIPAAIKSAALSIENIDRTAVDDLHILLKDRVKLDPETLEVFVCDAEGKVAVDEDLLPVSVDRLVRDFVKSRPRMVLDKQVAGTGLKPNPREASKMGTWAQVREEIRATNRQAPSEKADGENPNDYFFGGKMAEDLRSEYKSRRK